MLNIKKKKRRKSKISKKDLNFRLFSGAKPNPPSKKVDSLFSVSYSLSRTQVKRITVKN